MNFQLDGKEFWDKIETLYGDPNTQVSKKAPEIINIPVQNVHRPHGIKDEKKLNNIMDSMKHNGWQGRPLLVERDKDDPNIFWSWNGSHRISSARLVGLKEVPAMIIDTKALENMGYKRDEGRGIGNKLKSDDAKFGALIVSKEKGPDVDLMRQEVLSNKEQYRKKEGTK